MARKIFILFFLFLFLPNTGLQASELGKRLAGRMLLAVEGRGEAWYVEPQSLMRIFLGRPQDAFALMRGQGIGIKNQDLARIPIGIIAGIQDSDNDGLPDDLEKALGTDWQNQDSDGDNFNDYDEIKAGFNPLGKSRLPFDFAFAAKQKGKIFLAVEGRGEAWYINPLDSKRYFLGRPENAFLVMRLFGLGIKSSELAKINILTPNYNLSAFETLVFDLVNQKREKAGLPRLALNPKLGEVAREHSRDLARENNDLTALNKICDYPLIHHEGFVFGAYAHERLNNHGVYYFSKSGENIALMPGAAVKILDYSQEIETNFNSCREKRQKLEKDFAQSLEKETDREKKMGIVSKEVEKRKNIFKSEPAAALNKIEWDSQEDTARKTVDGWLESPGHKRNILDYEFDESGLGAAYVNGYLITTQIFIKRVDCGFKGGACCKKEGYYPYCYEPHGCKNGICG